MKEFNIVYENMPSLYNHTVEGEDSRDALVKYCKRLDASILEHVRNTAIIRYWKNMDTARIRIFVKKTKKAV